MLTMVLWEHFLFVFPTLALVCVLEGSWGGQNVPPNAQCGPWKNNTKKNDGAIIKTRNSRDPSLAVL